MCWLTTMHGKARMPHERSLSFQRHCHRCVGDCEAKRDLGTDFVSAMTHSTATRLETALGSIVAAWLVHSFLHFRNLVPRRTI